MDSIITNVSGCSTFTTQIDLLYDRLVGELEVVWEQVQLDYLFGVAPAYLPD